MRYSSIIFFSFFLYVFCLYMHFLYVIIYIYIYTFIWPDAGPVKNGLYLGVPRPGGWKLRPVLLKCQRLSRKTHRHIPVFQKPAVEHNSIVSTLSLDNNYHYFHFAPFCGSFDCKKLLRFESYRFICFIFIFICFGGNKFKTQFHE